MTSKMKKAGAGAPALPTSSDRALHPRSGAPKTVTERGTERPCKTLYACPVCGKPKGDYTPKPDGGWWVGCFSGSCDTGGEYLRALAEYVGAPHGAAVLDDPPQWLSHLATGASPIDGALPPLPPLGYFRRCHARFRRRLALQNGLATQWNCSRAVLREAYVGWDPERSVYVLPMFGADLGPVAFKHLTPGAKPLACKGNGRPWPLWPHGRQDTRWVFLTEGEKDCARLRTHDQPALAVTGGAHTWRDAWADELRGLSVAVLYDVGAESWAAKAVGRLRDGGIRAKWIDLRKLGLSEKNEDVSDYLNGGGSLDDLLAHVPAAWRAS